MTKEEEKISQLEQRNLALLKDKEDLLQLNANLTEQLTELSQTNSRLEEEILAKRLEILKTPLAQPQTSKIEREKTLLIIFLLIILSTALIFK